MADGHFAVQDDDDAPYEPANITQAADFVRGDHAEIAERLVQRLEETGLVVWDGGAAWQYAETLGIWRRVDVHTLRRLAIEFAGSLIGVKKQRYLMINESTLRGVVAIAETQTIPREGERTFAERMPGVAFRDVFVTVDGGKVVVRPHSPDHMARAAFDFDYDDQASCDRLLEFWEQVFGDASEDDRVGRFATIHEFVGASLMGMATRYQRALLFLGRGGNGKSTANAIIRALFPPELISHLSPRDWSRAFALVALDGKILNIVDEMPEREASSEIFKQVISGNELDCDRKFGARFVVRPIAGQLFSGNEPPSTNDVSEGFFRRIIPINFGMKMHLHEGHRLCGEDYVLEQKPGIIVAMLRAGAELVKRGRYAPAASSDETLEEIRDESDNVRAFVKRTIGEAARQPKTLARWGGADLYKMYGVWCGENGHKPMSSSKFGRRAVATEMLDRTKSSGMVYEPSSTSWERAVATVKPFDWNG